MDVNQLATPPPPARTAHPVWDWLRRERSRGAKLLAGGLLLLLFAVVIGRPILRALLFPPGCTIGDTRACTLVRQWSDTISKLGIEPVFPPEEDLHVGDVFAVLTSIAGHENRDPILSKAVKIAHLDLSPALAEVYRQLPVFPDSPTFPGQAEAAVSAGADIFQGAWPRSRLPLVAFPTLTIEHTLSLDGGWGLLGAVLGASGSAEDVETIELIDTSSYGVPALYATEALEGFCRQAAELCSEEGARRLVSYVVGARFAFAARRDGKPVNEVSLYIVDRVYLARTIREHRGNETADSASGSLGTDRHVGSKTGGQSSILLNQTFPRPVAIGFRAVHVQPVAPGQPIPPRAASRRLTLPELLMRSVESAGLITAPPPLAQDKSGGPAPPAGAIPAPASAAPASAAAPVPAPTSPQAAAVAPAAGDCGRNGVSPLLCGALHPTLRAPDYGNTQGVSPEARRLFDAEQTEIPAQR